MKMIRPRMIPPIKSPTLTPALKIPPTTAHELSVEESRTRMKTKERVDALMTISFDLLREFFGNRKME